MPEMASSGPSPATLLDKNPLSMLMSMIMVKRGAISDMFSLLPRPGSVPAGTLLALRVKPFHFYFFCLQSTG